METITRLIAQATSVPLIGADEEPKLVEAAQAGNRRAAERLILAHTRLSVGLAIRYRRYGLPVEDLIQAGNMGLSDALGRYRPGHGTRFASYAMWWIRAAVQEFVLRNVSMVKIGTTSRQKALFFKVRSARVELERAHPDAGPAEITALLAGQFGAEVDEVDRIFAALGGGDWSLDAPAPNRDDEPAFGDLIADERPSPEEVAAERLDGGRHLEQLRDAVGRLPARYQQVIHYRTLAEDPMTLGEVGAKLAVSKERVRQIEVKAVELLARDLQGRAMGRHLEVAACL